MPLVAFGDSENAENGVGRQASLHHAQRNNGETLCTVGPYCDRHRGTQQPHPPCQLHVAYPTHRSMSVSFKGIIEEVEAQKGERRIRKQLEKKRRKMAAQSRKEDIHYFLRFLGGTLTEDERRRRITENAFTNAAVTLMFPEDDENLRWQLFDEVVLNCRLPAGKKRVRERQIGSLGQIMDEWADRGLYDTELDRFLQYLCETIGQRNLEELILGILSDDDGDRVDEAHRAEARRMAQALVAGGNIGTFPASALPEDSKVSLRGLKDSMKNRGAYDSGELATQTSSSEEESSTEEAEYI